MHVRDLARALLDLGHDIHVLTGGSGVFTEALDSYRVPFRSIAALVRPLRPWNDARAVLEIVRTLREIDPDLVSAHSSKAGIVARIAGSLLAIPTLFTAHGWSFTEGVPTLRRYSYLAAERIAGPLAARIITVSDYDRSLALRHRLAAPGRIVTIHNGMPDVDPLLHSEPGRTPPLISVIARMAPPKDFRTLLEALAGLVDLDWRLEWIGGGPDQPVAERLCAEIGLADRVRFLGDRNDVAHRLAAAQLFVLPTRWEGFPRSILEAMRAGLPVVATDVGGVRESISHGTTGLRVPRSKPDDLRDALRTLIEDPTKRVRMGRAGRRTYESRFTLERMVAETLALYDEVLLERNGLTRPAASMAGTRGCGLRPPP